MTHLRPIDTWFVERVLPLEPMLLASARKLVDEPDAARDLVQEAFTRVLALEGWARIEAPHAYLLRMIKNLAIERLRQARVARFDQLSQVEVFDTVDETPDAFQVLSGREQLRRLEAALSRLPERCRRVFVMRRIEDQAPRDIARTLGVSLSTLEKRLARAHYLVAQALAAQPAGADASPGKPRDEASAPVRRSR